MAHYKLTYFPVRARGEPIRIILTLAETDWEDIRDVSDSDLEALNKRGYTNVIINSIIQFILFRYNLFCLFYST